jgi:Ca2+-binding RTX toxin-like protein
VLISGNGSDTMTGGADADRFVHTTDDLHFGDVITDFNRVAGDRIDLSAMDADTVEAGDQAFVFIGTAAFSHRAGELRYLVTGPDAVASGDVDGDGVADFRITLLGVPDIVAGDFAL